jgi:predicted nucleic acid-binding protein
VTAILIDSDVVIELLRGRDAALQERLEALVDADTLLACSPVTLAEIWHGARPGERGVIEALFESMVCVPVDGQIGRKAGEYLRLYRRSHGVELGDALIAATAATHGLKLWTRNRKHYPMREISHY